MRWFGDGTYGHVKTSDVSAFEVEAFRARAAATKRGRERSEAALAEVEAHARGEVMVRPSNAVAVEAVEAVETVEEAKEEEAKEKKRGGRRKRLVEEAEDAGDEDEGGGDAEMQEAEGDADDYEPEAADEKPKASAKKRKLTKKADGEEKEEKKEAKKEPKEKKPAAVKKPKEEIEKPVVKVASSTPKLLELKAELEDGLQAYDDVQNEREQARLEYERAKEALAAAQTKVEQASSHANRVVRRLKQTARHIQEQSVSATMLQETLITKTVKKASKIQDPSLVDFSKTCAAVTTEWIELVRTSAVNLLAIKPVEEVKKVVAAQEERAPAENVKTKDTENAPATEKPAKSNLPPVLAERFAKTAPLAKPAVASASASGVPKEPVHDATRLRVARYLEGEHGLSRNAAVTLEAALFDQTAEAGIAYKAALKRVVEQPSLLASNASALDVGNVRPALLLAFRST